MTDDLNALRHIEGFPIGEDEDMLALSDPPYYTAYPNPHIAEFIEKWGKPYDEATDDYQREPYVADVSEGKNDPIYNAHSYHTKVPYKAIVPFIKHYTQPGDVVFDGFCGTGMTGVAAQMAGRHAILSDLSPAATFIAYNTNVRVDAEQFERLAKEILAEVGKECGWMYETWHPHSTASSRVKARIDYTVWSDVFLCPYCNSEIVYYEAAADKTRSSSSSDYACPKCGAFVSTRSAERGFESLWDADLQCEVRRVRRVPVEIHYAVSGQKAWKRPDAFDLELLQTIERVSVPYWYPTNRMPPGDEARRNDPQGMTHVHHFYMKRSLYAFAALWARVARLEGNSELRTRLRFWLESLAVGQTHLNRYFEASYSQVNRYLKGTLYVGPKKSEVAPHYAYSGKIAQIARASRALPRTDGVLVGTCSAGAECLPENSIDYVYTDPPFGANIMYSDLNYIWESWLKVWTNNAGEAVISESQGKSLADYHSLMLRSFRQMYRALKPGRWITVVFHNSRASVWNAIQEALSKAGFVVAQVVTLDKQQKTMQQMTSAGAVKNDLVISAYKPRVGFSDRFISRAGQGLEADFIDQHLQQLPPANVERSKEMLYSKYLAYYVQHGYQVAYNGEQFYRALGQWGFVERDGYWFVDEKQANEYEKRKAVNLGKTKTGQAVLFISDEKSARQWLWHFLETPKSYGEIYTAFVKALQTPEDQLPEPRVMLEEGFIQANGEWRRPDAVSQAELERRRQARLLSQFEEYLAAARAGQRLKEVRKEAVVAGFAEAYRGARWGDILAVGRRLPKRLIENDPDIFDFIDIAESKVEA